MSKVIEFPVPVREVMVVKIYSGLSLGRYAMVIVDPEIGMLCPYQYHGFEKIQEMVAMLSDDAKNRKLGFEVQDFSTKSTIFITDNDNEVHI